METVNKEAPAVAEVKPFDGVTYTDEYGVTHHLEWRGKLKPGRKPRK